MEANQMMKLMIGVSLAALLSTAALAQTDKSIPARPDPSVNANQPTTGSKVAPLPAPDASTQPGQERGNAEILEQSQQNAPGTGGTSKPGAGEQVGPDQNAGASATERQQHPADPSTGSKQGSGHDGQQERHGTEAATIIAGFNSRLFAGGEERPF
jgi:hypothetical protein